MAARFIEDREPAETTEPLPLLPPPIGNRLQRNGNLARRYRVL